MEERHHFFDLFLLSAFFCSRRCPHGNRSRFVPVGRHLPTAHFLRHAAAHRLGDEHRRSGTRESRPVQLLQRVRGDPPVVVFSPMRKSDGSKKDTLANIEATGDFVVNAAVAHLAEEVNLSAKDLPHGESEVELTGLSLAPSKKVKTPRLAESPLHMECVLRQVLPVGDRPYAANLVIGEVVLFHFDDSLLDTQGLIDPRKLKTIARLGGSYYCHTSDLFEMKGP